MTPTDLKMVGKQSNLQQKHMNYNQVIYKQSQSMLEVNPKLNSPTYMNAQ